MFEIQKLTSTTIESFKARILLRSGLLYLMLERPLIHTGIYVNEEYWNKKPKRSL